MKTEIRLNPSPVNTKKILNPKLRVKSSPVNKTFIDRTPRLSFKQCSMNNYHQHQICVYTIEASIEVCFLGNKNQFEVQKGLEKMVVVVL